MTHGAMHMTRRTSSCQCLRKRIRSPTSAPRLPKRCSRPPILLSSWSVSPLSPSLPLTLSLTHSLGLSVCVKVCVKVCVLCLVSCVCVCACACVKGGLAWVEGSGGCRRVTTTSRASTSYMASSSSYICVLYFSTSYISVLQVSDDNITSSTP